MGIPFGLSDKGEAVWNFIQSAITRGLSMNQTLLSLRKEGLSYRRDTFRKDFNLGLGLEEKKPISKFVPKKYRITDKHYTLAKHPLSGGFRQTVFKLDAWDTEKEEWVERIVTVAHDTITIRGELEATAERVAQGTSPHLDKIKIIPIFGRKWPANWEA